MDYTLENLIQILRKRLQDEEFDGSLLTTYLNDSLNEILGEDKFPFMQQIDEYAAEQKGEISLPLGYSQTFFIFAKKDKQPREKLKYISPQEFFENTKRHSMVWTKFANSIFYRLRVDKDDYEWQGWTVMHLYLANPVPLKKSTDRPPIPPQYMEALILGALARAEETRDNFDYAQLFRNQQDNLLTNMKLRYGPDNLSAENRAKLPYFGAYADERH